MLEKLVSYIRRGRGRILAGGLIGAGSIFGTGCDTDMPNPPTNTNENDNAVVTPPSDEPHFIEAVADENFKYSYNDEYAFVIGTNLSPGDFIYSTKGKGFLRRITSGPKIFGTSESYFTEQGYINEIVSEGSLQFEDGPGKLKLNGKEFNIFNVERTIDNLVLFEESGAKVTVDGSFDVHSLLGMSLDLRNREVERFESRLEGDVGANLDIYAEFNAERDVNFNYELLDESTNLYGTIGGFPVFVRVRFSVNLEGEGGFSAHADSHASASGSYHMDIGGIYSSAGGWERISDQERSLEAHLDDFCFSGDGDMEVRLVPKISATLYGLVGPVIGTEFYVRGNAAGNGCLDASPLEDYLIELETGIRAPASISLSSIINTHDLLYDSDLFDGHVKRNWTWGSFDDSSGGGGGGGGLGCTATEVEPNDAAASANTFEPCDNYIISGITNPTDSDYFSIYVDSGSTLTFSSTPGEDNGGVAIIFNSKYVGPGSAFNPYHVTESRYYTLQTFQYDPSFGEKNYSVRVEKQ